MQSDHVLKKLNFDLLTQGSGDGGEQGSAGKIFAIHDSLKFDMQNDHVLKKLNFDVLTPLPKSTQGGGHRSLIENHV